MPKKLLADVFGQTDDSRVTIFLLQNNGFAFSKTQIINNTHIPTNKLWPILYFLKKRRFIKSEKKDRRWTFTWDTKSKTGKALLDLYRVVVSAQLFDQTEILRD